MNNFDFSSLYRSAIGFDNLINLLETEKSQNTSSSYPPYNIELVNDTQYCISISVTGFSKNELEITSQNNLLIVKGKNPSKKERNYLYKGIPDGNFELEFQLAEHIKVKNASFVNGLLNINLERNIPESLQPKRIIIDEKNYINHKRS